MNQKTQEYVQFITENHKDFFGDMNGSAIAKHLGISQGRVSQIIKGMKDESKDPVATVQGPVVVEAAA